MKILKHSYFMFIVLIAFVAGCKKMPTAMEGTADITIKVVDTTGVMNNLYGNAVGRYMQVIIQSIHYGTKFQAESDSNGIVQFHGLLSDKYYVIATRQMSAAEMLKGCGKTMEGRLSGGSSSVEVRADVTASVATINVSLSLVSDIVISEIYACGPVGSGNYFHDKYIEVCNISDTTQYLDGLLVVRVYKDHLTDPLIYSTEVWKFPGTGKEYPIQQGQFVVAAEDAIDHRTVASGSVDLSHADFEFYRSSQPDVDNTAIPNMIEIFQTAGVDWLIGGQQDALILCRVPSVDSLKYAGNYLTIPKQYVIDGVEYYTDPTQLDKKILDPAIDAGMTGGIIFYTGYSMERKLESANNARGWTLQDYNNSSSDFEKIQPPTPGYHHALQ
jgi:hypothetical protein